MARTKCTAVRTTSVAVNKKRRRRRATYGAPKYVKRPGFDAFTVKHTTPDGKKVLSTEVVEPEIGIHSLAWAQSITPQASGFLRLPIEVRHKIYEHLLDEAVIVHPRKNGMKFVNPNRPSSTIQTYNTLSQICRQAYVDVVGGGILHSFAKFQFSSPDAMYKYLSCINPAHKSSIRNINLSVKLTRNANTLPKKMFTTLGSLPNLYSLHVDVAVDFDLCAPTAPPPAFFATNNHGVNMAYLVRGRVLAKLERLMYWSEIKGLGEFEIKFRAAGQRPSVTQYSSIRRCWGRFFDDEDPKLLVLAEEIKKIVLK